jgi:CO/xanthine dehydrogenase Mo-binding subunit
VEGQMQGAVSQGIGWALMEDYILQEGGLPQFQQSFSFWLFMESLPI